VLRTIDGGSTWKNVSPTGLDIVPEFRDIEAWSAKHAVALAIGTGEASRIYETTNGGRTWTETFRNTDPDAFYDCMAFSASGRGLALSDPVGGYFRLAVSRDFGAHWRVQSTAGMPPALAGEFGFAASGTCLVSGAFRNFWFASGGVDTPRVFHSSDGGRTWDAVNGGLIGGPSAGVFSIAMKSVSEGITVGGDYLRPDSGDIASAYYDPLLGFFRSSSRGYVSGYRSGVAFVPHTPDTAIAVGPNGSDYTLLGGYAWRRFSDEGFDAVQCASTGACWASGTDGRIAKLVLERDGGTS
jgi:photosystem II stability/assembly factor-like uncharacterized protein